MVVGEEGPGDEAPGDQPPLADYDHLPKVLVENRAARMPREQVEALLRYESAHRARTPVIRVLRSRLHQIENSGRQQGAVGGYGGPPLPKRPAPARTAPPRGTRPDRG